MTITSLEFELGPASSDPGSPLPRFSCLSGSSCSSRFRLRLAGADRGEPSLGFSSLSDSTRIGSLGVTTAFGVEACEVGTDGVCNLGRDWIDSNSRWVSNTGMVNNREDDPTGPGPTLEAGGGVDGSEAPGPAYSSVQRLAVSSWCFLFLTYSVAIDGTIDVRTNDA